MRGLGRKLRQTFGISAPRMAVRTHLSWRWKISALLGLLLLIVGMWWWGFDFGQFLGGFDRGQVAERQKKLESEVAQFRDENVKLRARAARLESDLNITEGAQATLSKQSLELQAENTQIKASGRKYADQGRARFSPKTVQRHRQAGHDFHPASLSGARARRLIPLQSAGRPRRQSVGRICRAVDPSRRALVGGTVRDRCAAR